MSEQATNHPMSTNNNQRVVLVPQPTDDPDDPLASTLYVNTMDSTDLVLELAIAQEDTDVREHRLRGIRRPNVAKFEPTHFH